MKMALFPHACIFLLAVKLVDATTFVVDSTSVQYNGAVQICTNLGLLPLELCDATVAYEFWSYIASMNALKENDLAD